MYEGLVYMNFSRDLFESQGFGNYENVTNISADKFDKFFLAYLADPSDSGKIHSDVRQRFDAGEAQVVEAMKVPTRYLQLVATRSGHQKNRFSKMCKVLWML